MKKVAVASCAHYAWLESSYAMGRYLAKAVGTEVEMHVHTPIDQNGLIACLSDTEFFIMHTHGSPDGFYDQRADQKQTVIATLQDVAAFPKFPDLRLVIITACETAGGINDANIASALSTRIAENGLVIANRYNVFGADFDFGEQSGKQGWVGYQNGVLVLTENDFPATITFEDAYRIYLRFVHRD